MRVLLTLVLVLDFFIFHCSSYRGLEVRPEDLYEGAANEDVLDCLRHSINNNNDAESCKKVDKKGREIIDDNLCRYYSTYFLKVKGRLRKRSRDCSCCGHFYQYIEQGKICTRYCTGLGLEALQRKPLIKLPFNWGDECPEEIFLGDKKTPVPEKLKECEDLMEDFYNEETEELENHQDDRVVTERKTTTVNTVKKATSRQTTLTPPTTTPPTTPTTTSTTKTTKTTTTVTTTTTTTKTSKRQDLSVQKSTRRPGATVQTSNRRATTVEPRSTSTATSSTATSSTATSRPTTVKPIIKPTYQAANHTLKSTTKEKISLDLPDKITTITPGPTPFISTKSSPREKQIWPSSSNQRRRLRRKGKQKNRRKNRNRNRHQATGRKVSDPNKPTTTLRKETREDHQLSDIDGKPIWG